MNKKSFKGSAAMQFISTPTEPDAPEQTEQFQITHAEKRTKRVQLVFTPSLYENVKAAAEYHKLSFNEYCNQVLSQAAAQTIKGDNQ